MNQSKIDPQFISDNADAIAVICVRGVTPKDISNNSNQIYENSDVKDMVVSSTPDKVFFLEKLATTASRIINPSAEISFNQRLQVKLNYKRK